jgi:hypothetical protein
VHCGGAAVLGCRAPRRQRPLSHPGITGPEHTGRRFSCPVEMAQQRMMPVAAFEIPVRQLLLRERVRERRVDIQHRPLWTVVPSRARALRARSELPRPRARQRPSRTPPSKARRIVSLDGRSQEPSGVRRLNAVPLIGSLPMVLRRLARSLFFLTAIVLTSVASAYAKPSLTLTLPSQTDAGTPTHFSWSGPSGGTLLSSARSGLLTSGAPFRDFPDPPGRASSLLCP